MSKGSRFGFLLGLLAGTATVGAVGIMTGQANASGREPSRPGQRLVTTQSADGLTIYLWRIAGDSGAIEFAGQSTAPPDLSTRPER